MSSVNFGQSLVKVLAYEGGYSNDPGDPGGATMWGITHIDYDGYRSIKGLPLQDVRKITVAERDEIYHNKYWMKSRGDELPPGVDFVVFDGAVNSGVSQSIKWLQRAVGVPADGAPGDVTLAATLVHPDKHALVNKICDQRLVFLQSLKIWSIFGRGWGARVANVRATGLAWADVATAEPVREGAGKALAEEPAPGEAGAKAVVASAQETAISPATSTATATGAGIGSGAMQQLHSTMDTLQPLSYTIKWIGYALAALAVGGALYTIYALWRQKKVKDAMA